MKHPSIQFLGLRTGQIESIPFGKTLLPDLTRSDHHGVGGLAVGGAVNGTGIVFTGRNRFFVADHMKLLIQPEEVYRETVSLCPEPDGLALLKDKDHSAVLWEGFQEEKTKQPLLRTVGHLQSDLLPLRKGQNDRLPVHGSKEVDRHDQEEDPEEDVDDGPPRKFHDDCKLEYAPVQGIG